MLANAWAFEAIRYFGAGYLMFLAYKSARSAMTPGTMIAKGVTISSPRRAFAKGFVLHLTNPKAVLFFGSLFAIGIPADASPGQLVTVIVAVGLQSALIFHGYAVLFSSQPIVAGYLRLRRWLEGIFAIAFAAASIKVLTSRIQ